MTEHRDEELGQFETSTQQNPPTANSRPLTASSGGSGASALGAVSYTHLDVYKRQVFYQRLELIERLPGVDLADGETVAALTVALLARPQ